MKMKRLQTPIKEKKEKGILLAEQENFLHCHPSYVIFICLLLSSYMHIYWPYGSSFFCIVIYYS